MIQTEFKELFAPKDEAAVSIATEEFKQEPSNRVQHGVGQNHLAVEPLAPTESYEGHE